MSDQATVDAVMVQRGKMLAHQRRWAERLVRCDAQGQAGAVLSLAVKDEAHTVSRLDLEVVPTRLRSAYVTFVCGSVAEGALVLAPNHQLKSTFVGMVRACLALLEDPEFIVQLAREICRHEDARRVRAAAVSTMRNDS